MKKIVVSIALLIVTISVYGQEDNKEVIKVSSYKNVYVTLPPGYEIVDINEGMDEVYFKGVIVAPNVFSVKAGLIEVNGEVKSVKFPDSNISIECKQGIFQANVSVDHGAARNHYELTEDYLIIKYDVANTYTKPQGNDPSAATASNNSVNEYYSPEKTSNKEGINFTYFEKDRSVIPIRSNGIDLWINNIVTTSNYNYISLNIRNNSSVPFETDFVQFLIIPSSSNKSDAITLSAENTPITFEEYNSFKRIISPGETVLYICKFNSFSINKKDELQLMVQEGGDKRRSIILPLSSKTFYKEAIVK